MSEIKPVSNKCSRTRLLRLAEFLEALPSQRFDYGDWGTRVGSFLATKDVHACGTTACAMGWAALMPEFRALGVVKDEVVSMRMVDEKGTMIAVGPILVGMALFGLTLEESRFLFIPHNFRLGRFAPHVDASKEEVAAHIRQFVTDFRPESRD